MVLIAVHLHALGNLHHFAIHAYGQVALFAHALKEFAIVALTVSHHRSQEQYFPSRIVTLNHFQHVLLGIFHHRFASHIAVGLAGACIEQSQVVVNLGSRTHRRARILVGSLLFDTDHRRQTRNLVNIGSFHAPQEVAGIGRERLDIASLTFGEDGVEGQ